MTPPSVASTADHASVPTQLTPDAPLLDHAPSLAKDQAAALAAKLQTEGGPPAMQNKEVIALIAYMQRLGVDIRASKQGGTK